MHECHKYAFFLKDSNTCHHETLLSVFARSILEYRIHVARVTSVEISTVSSDSCASRGVHRERIKTELLPMLLFFCICFYVKLRIRGTFGL